MTDHRRRATDQTREGDAAGELAAEVARLRATIARRDEEIARYDDELSAWRGVTALPLYCWSCRTVHEIALPDVERIVYALGAAEMLAYQSGFDDGSTGEPVPTRLPEDPTTCHRTTLRHAGDIEVFAEHVEQGVECSKAITRDPGPDDMTEPDEPVGDLTGGNYYTSAVQAADRGQGNAPRDLLADLQASVDRARATRPPTPVTETTTEETP